MVFVVSLGVMTGCRVIISVVRVLPVHLPQARAWLILLKCNGLCGVARCNDRVQSHNLSHTGPAGTLTPQTRAWLIRRVFVQDRCDDWSSRGWRDVGGTGRVT